MNNISYILGDEKLLDELKELWEGLNEMHRKKTVHFKQFYTDFNFETRKADLIEKYETGQLRVEIAFDKTSQKNVGYCISGVDYGKIGEVESIYILQNYRGLDIGEKLMQKALQWMDETGVMKKVVTVAVGNENAFGFYERFGFYPRKTLMEQVKG